MTSTLPAVLVWIPYRSRDGDLADTVDAVVAQTHEPVECQVLVQPSDVAGVHRAQRCAQLYPGHDIRVVQDHHDEVIRNTTAPLVLPLRLGQILSAQAIAQLVEQRHHDETLSVVFSQPNTPGRLMCLGPDQPDQPELSELVLKPRPFECALYDREALLAVAGFDGSFDGGYTTWELWVQLLAAGHRFRRLHRALLADVFGVDREHLWTLSLDPEQELDLGRWARLVQKNHRHFPEARVELAGEILAQGSDLAPETRAALIQALHEDGWPEAARPHVEFLLQDGGRGLLPGARAWLAHVRGLCLLSCGRRSEAARSFHLALATRPGNAESHGMLARIAQADGDHDRALRHAEDALELEPREEWRQLVDVLAPPTGTRKPYIVFYPGRANTHGRHTMWPVLEAVLAKATCDATLVFRNERHGLAGEGFALAHARMNRRPDALVVFRPWWGEELEVARAARAHGVPVVMISDGAMSVRNDSQLYRESLYPADVSCIWSWRDQELWQGWNRRDRFVVTGNPSHDVLAAFRPEPVELPARYALFLTPGPGAASCERELLLASARNLRKHIDVVVKCHPHEPHADELSREFLTFTDDAHLLFTLVHWADLVASNASSALTAALYFQKPIFIHSHEEQEGDHFEEFRRRYAGVFNFKSTPGWSKAEVQTAVQPTLADYEHFAHRADGGNTARVLEVIEEYAFRSRSERPQAVALPLPEPEAMTWA
ncbi:MAG: hypothetical protein ACYTGW_03785 [Planctomycetota bacterium]